METSEKNPQKVFKDDTIKEADDYTHGTFDDIYLNMELALPCSSNGPKYEKITKLLWDADGIPIGTAKKHTILDTRLYEVNYSDWTLRKL